MDAYQLVHVTCHPPPANILSIDKLQYIARLEKYFVSLENGTFCCPVLGSQHSTRAYTETVYPACRPGIPKQWYLARYCTAGAS